MRSLLLLSTILLVAGCSPKVTTNPDARLDVKAITASELLVKKVELNRFTANWVDAKANIKLESSAMNVGGTAFIRLEKDRRLWVSVKKFGFEAARVLITPDSFFVINRLSNEFTAEPLSYVEEKYNIPARFDLLQEIVLGNAVFLDRQLKLATKDDVHELKGTNGRYLSAYYVDAFTYRLNSMRLKERAADREVNIFMDDYQDTDTGVTFAMKRALEMESPTTGLAKVELEFSKVSFNEEVGMPFSVPGRFERGE